MLKYSLLFAAVGLLLFTTSCFSQTEVDSLLNRVRLNRKDTTHIQALLRLSVLAEETNFARARQYLKDAVSLSDQPGLQKLRVEALHSITKLYRHAHIHDTAIFYANQARKLAVQLGDANVEAEINIDAGNVYLNSSNYLEALSQFIAAARIFDSLKTNPKGQMMAYANIGNIQTQLNNNEKALDYLNRGLSIAKTINFENGIAYCYKAKGRVFRKDEKIDSAIVAYEQALNLYRALDNQWQISEVHHSLGNIYFDQKDYSKSINTYEKSLTIARRIQHQPQMAYCYTALGDTWMVLKNNKKAAAYLDSTLLISKGTLPYLEMDSYQRLAQIAEEEGQYKRSLVLFQHFVLLRDSLNTVENRSAAEEIEAKYQNTAKQNQIELLEKDKALQLALLNRQQANILIVIILLISVVIISIILVNRYRVLNRTRRLVEMERMRNTIARDLHDDIGSTLSSINIMSQLALQENARHEQGDTSTHLKKIANHSARMMENMSDIVWSINPRNDSLEQVVIKMKEFAAEILEPKNMEYVFNIENNIQVVKLDAEKRKNIFLIFKEAVNNAAKYSEGSNLTISLFTKHNALHLLVEDNGKGFEPVGVTQGNGLRNMESRAHSMNGKMMQASRPGSGTTIQLEVPLT
jgi:two-component system sensor histidine kinase UhpB